MKLDQIPQELKNKPQWVCWRYELRNGKKTKVPMTPAGQCASTTGPNTWSSFEAVVSAISKFDGIGFVFAGEHIGARRDVGEAASGGR